MISISKLFQSCCPTASIHNMQFRIFFFSKDDRRNIIICKYRNDQLINLFIVPYKISLDIGFVINITFLFFFKYMSKVYVCFLGLAILNPSCPSQIVTKIIRKHFYRNELQHNNPNIVFCLSVTLL